MDSKVDLSLFVPLITHDSVKTKLKNLRKGRSAYIT